MLEQSMAVTVIWAITQSLKVSLLDKLQKFQNIVTIATVFLLGQVAALILKQSPQDGFKYSVLAIAAHDTVFSVLPDVLGGKL